MLFPFLLFKKSDKQILKTYPPVSLLPVCGKIFEKLIFNKIFKIFIENNLISPNQSGFKSGDSCVNQLLCITPDIIKSFGCGYKVRGVFLNIWKVFDKVSHDGVIFKTEADSGDGAVRPSYFLQSLNFFCSYFEELKLSYSKLNWLIIMHN